jgi:hypothetical protein
VDSTIRQALAKNPVDRPTMEELVGDLGDRLSELGSPDREATAILPGRKPEKRRRPGREPVQRQRRRRRVPWPLLAVVLGIAIAAAVVAVVLASRDGDGGGASANGNPPPAGPVALKAVASHDPPPGDGHEHDERIQFATDGDPTTYWETEHYNEGLSGSGKKGVGLVLDARRPVRLERLSLQSDTPGFDAVIKAGSSTSGPFTQVSSSQTVQSSARFSLTVAQPERYYMIWVTSLAPGFERTHVNEVTASTAG